MKSEIKQIIKQLNNTELGKSGMNDTYVLMPAELDISGVFDVADRSVPFVDKASHKKYSNIRLTAGQEHRICGLGDYYRDKGLSAGDEILFEKRLLGDRTEFFLDVRKLTNTIVLMKDTNGYEVLTPEKLSLFEKGTVLESVTKEPLSIVFSQKAKKRKDSKEMTDYYRILLDGKDYQSHFEKKKDLIEIEVANGVATIRKGFVWKKIEFTWGS